MGLTYVTATIRPLERSKKKFESEFLVETGALDCVVPAKSLRKIGVPVEGKASYSLADGSTHEFEYGFIKVGFLGDETVTRVVFGPEDSEPLLGVVVLESMGIGVDPVSRTLQRMSSKPLKVVRRSG